MKNNNTLQSKNILRVALIAAVILMIPLVGTLTGGMNWGLADFLVIGSLLFVIGVAYELVMVKTANTNYRVVAAVLLGLAFLAIWAELAVGVFGTFFAGD